eukprot:CAMPEP_0174275694 /NCGR_PEP_ID=MMETSP0439-20130205/59963_1 /TAXON_ID=0 /ORGANISM="Stereomyxa ramosa, Strain Chinc5" /LENGTH=418 /DNA_ID=CAMNT_0015367827 /DNA_START=20 /DNA_END=1277 /DNA_ORIENTATION=-
MYAWGERDSDGRETSLELRSPSPFFLEDVDLKTEHKDEDEHSSKKAKKDEGKVTSKIIVPSPSASPTKGSDTHKSSEKKPTRFKDYDRKESRRERGPGEYKVRDYKDDYYSRRSSSYDYPPPFPPHPLELEAEFFGRGGYRGRGFPSRRGDPFYPPPPLSLSRGYFNPYMRGGYRGRGFSSRGRGRGIPRGGFRGLPYAPELYRPPFEEFGKKKGNDFFHYSKEEEEREKERMKEDKSFWHYSKEEEEKEKEKREDDKHKSRKRRGEYDGYSISTSVERSTRKEYPALTPRPNTKHDDDDYYRKKKQGVFSTSPPPHKDIILSPFKTRKRRSRSLSPRERHKRENVFVEIHRDPLRRRESLTIESQGDVLLSLLTLKEEKEALKLFVATVLQILIIRESEAKKHNIEGKKKELRGKKE